MNVRIFLLLILVFVAMNIKVDAYIPVTYMCCYNYTNDSGVQLANFEDKPLGGIQLDNFNNLSDWSVGGSLGYADETDTVNFKEGTQGIKLIAKYGNSSTYNNTFIDKSINNNFSTANNFGIWVYVYNASTFDYGIIFFTSDPTGNWNTYFAGFMTGLHAGWNKIILNQNNFITSPNPENWNNTMVQVRIAIYPTNGQYTNVTFGDLEYNVTNDWILGGVGGSLMADTVNFKEGQQGLKLSATNGNSSFIDNALNSNFLTTNNFAIWTYVDNADNLLGMEIYFTSDPTGNWGTYFYDSNYGVKTGWNKLIFNKHNFRNVGGEDWNNTMLEMRLRLLPQPNSDVNVTFDDLGYDTSGTRAKLMITFDDGYASVYTKAYPILAANNQTGVSFFVTSWIGNGKPPDNMNLSELKTLQGAGWDISSHTVDHCQGNYCTLLNDSALTSELNDSYAWLVDNGFQKSAGFIAYPFGTFDDTMLDKVKKRYVLGRSTNPEYDQQHFTPDDPIQYIQRTIAIENTTSVQSVEDGINDTINAKLLEILVLHDLTDSNPTTYQTLTSDFKKLSNYIKSRSSDIDVITYSDYVIPNINSFTPVINKTTRIYSNGSSILITNNKYDEYMPNMTIMPFSGSIDIGITTYNESGGIIKFNESGSNNNLQVLYSIGDRIPYRIYNVKIYWANGTLYQNFNTMSDRTGYIIYNSSGFGGSRYQEIDFVGELDTTFTVTLPAGYTFLRFNASDSTVTNLNPDGQNSSQPIFNITNNGNINQMFMLNLSNVVKNITTYGDLSNNFSTGKIEINASSAVVIPNLFPSQSQNLWMVIDTKNAPAVNINVTLMINSRNAN